MKVILKKEYGIYLIILLLLIPALFINLGMLPLITDEPTRGIVTLEMDITHHWYTPTINGEFYYNKPPLYNWILILFSKIAGIYYSEFILRLPTVLSLMGFALTLFLVLRNEIGIKQAFIQAMILITGGRILFWDSFQGLIDIFYSWVTFVQLYLIYYFYKKEQYARLFILSYFLVAVGYMLKGFPSLVFQAISLLVWFTAEKKFKKLLTWQHIFGIFVFLLITGSYYFIYQHYQSIENVFTTLWHESTKKTGIELGLKKTITGIFYFPVNMFKHFLPWTILLIFFIRKNVMEDIKNNSLRWYSFLIFISNIMVYWLSPDTLPRYLFMLFPFLYIVLLPEYFQHHSWQTKFINMLIPLLYFITGIGIFVAYLFLYKQHSIVFLTSSLILSIIFLIAGFLCYRSSSFKLEFFILLLISLRIMYNIFIMPTHSKNQFAYKEQAEKVALFSQHNNLYVYGTTPINHDATFYITRIRKQLLTRTSSPLPNSQLICDSTNLNTLSQKKYTYRILYPFEINLNNTKLYLIELNP